MTIPFGRHANQPLSDVPASYLQWALGNLKLGSGLRSAVADELGRRDIETPTPAPPRPLRPCSDHPAAGHLCFWVEDSLGRRAIRAECRRCRRAVDRPPVVPPYTDQADALASAAPVLDALIGLDGLDVELCSDGASVWVPPEDWRRVPQDLHSIIRQCRHQLARMIGDTHPPKS
jgi:hypothetical protein